MIEKKGSVRFDDLSFRLELKEDRGNFRFSKYGQPYGSVSAYSSSDKLRISLPVEEERSTMLFNKYYAALHGPEPKDSKVIGKYYPDDEEHNVFKSGTLVLSGWYVV